MSNFPQFPAGLHLLSGWQSGDAGATSRLKEIFDAAINGDADANFAIPAPTCAVNIGGSVNLLTLTIMHDLYGIESSEFYKGDAKRYVRTTLLTRRLLGMNKLYMSWPVYAFAAEALGQVMMYPDKFPPGSDPEITLINKDNFKSILKTPDFTTGIPKIVDDIIRFTEELTGLEPVLHLSAPYSLAADIYGQEPLLADLVHNPDFANEMLDHIVDTVLKPWIDHFTNQFPNGWAEMSDASGSPFFIGPENCKTVAIRAIKRLVDENPWGHRVYDANYRGDYVTQAKKKTRGRRKATSDDSGISIQELTDLKHSVCPDFIIRLDDDKVPLPFYTDQAIQRNVPLFTGIGVSQVDRNSIADLDMAKQDIAQMAADSVVAIKTVAQTIHKNGYSNPLQPWPGTVYFEDISSEAQFDLVEIIVREALNNGAFTL